MLKTSLLKTIAFFDCFDFPLTAEEIRERLYRYDKPVHIKAVKGILGGMVEEGKLETIKDYYVLKGHTEIINTRNARRFIAEKFWNRVRLYSQYMQRVPFVRMIAVCNNLSYDNVDEASDIDLFVVIEPERMWIARLIITLILQFFGVRRHGNKVAGRFCLSFFVTTRRMDMTILQITPEDPYLAYWAQTLTPIYGEITYELFKAANQSWLKEKYNLTVPDSCKRHLYPSRESLFKRFLEWMLNGHFGNGIETLLKKTFKKKTEAAGKRLDEHASVIIEDDILKFHNHDRRKEYLEKWEKTVAQISAIPSVITEPPETPFPEIQNEE